MSTQDHGSSLIKSGLIWFVVWLVTVIFLNLSLLVILNDMKRKTGPDGEQLLDITFNMVVGIALVGTVVLFVGVYLGGYALLMVAAGIFERSSGVFFHSLKDRLSYMEWYKQLALYPLLFVAIVLPFMLAGIILVVAAPIPVMATGYSAFDVFTSLGAIKITS